MKKSIIYLIGIVLIAGIVIAQVINFPSTFRMILNNLPAQQSSDQIIFNCPYDSQIEHRETEITHFNPQTREVNATIKYWTKDKKCAGSIKLNFTISPFGNQQQLIQNFILETNNKFIEEANINRRTQNRTIISRGGN